MTFVSKKKRLLAQLRFSLKALNRAERKCRPLLIGCSVHISAKDFFYEPLINCSKRHVECPICLKKKVSLLESFKCWISKMCFFSESLSQFLCLNTQLQSNLHLHTHALYLPETGLVPSEEIGMGRLKSCLRGCQGYKCLQW